MILPLPLLGLLALLHHGDAKWTSPIVYPTPNGYGARNWSAAYAKAKALIAKMSLAEMNNLTYGFSDSATSCAGISGSVPRLGFPGFCLQDAGNGVRDTDGVSGYASGVSIGASFNASLAYQRAQYMGAEFKAKGVNVALGPVIAPLGRVARGGRNWEGFAADPYLNGMLGAQAVMGLQENVIASVKHFIAYEQETNRNPYTVHGKTIMSVSSNVDDLTMHEIYLWPFQDLVYAGAGCVMCSYNRINNTYACQNSKTLNGLLKGELNFQGFVVSDWGGQHSGISSANAGLDMAMPDSAYWENNTLVRAVHNGSMNQTRLVDMATRIVAAWYQMGEDDLSRPSLGIGMPPDLDEPHLYINAKDPASKPSLLEQAIQSHVLVKNSNNALPLKDPAVISIFGYDAVTPTTYNPGNTMVHNTTYDLFPTNELDDFTQEQLKIMDEGGYILNGPQTFPGTLNVGGGSGANSPAYISTPYNALQDRAYQDDTAIFFDFTSENPSVVSSSDACLVFVNEYSSEGWDRNGLADPRSDKLISNVASKCNNTIVVVHNAGIRLVDDWIEHPNITAVLFAHLPGQDSGHAAVKILYGDAGPSGRLPYTVAKSAGDYNSLLGPCLAHGSTSPQCTFTEGVDIDYRHFLAHNITPRYAFGYGLTYSSFSYSALAIKINATATNDSTSTAPVYSNGTTEGNGGNPAVGEGGLNSLFQSVGTVTATVRNTGSVAASEVAQLYVQTTSMTTRALRGFQKVLLQPGESAQVTFNLRQKDVSSWNTAKQAWVVPSGTFDIFVGPNVLDTPLTGRS